MFGRKQEGNVLVVDRFSACRALAKEAGFILQFCWSHILDDSRGLAKNFGEDGKYVHKKLKKIYEKAVSFDHKGNLVDVNRLKKRIFNLTQRKYQSSTVRKFVKTLYERDIESLFIFVTDPDVDPTNNISERELRKIVIIRKISNGSRSRKGAKITAELLSVIQTARMQKEGNILYALKEIINNPSLY